MIQVIALKAFIAFQVITGNPGDAREILKCTAYERVMITNEQGVKTSFLVGLCSDKTVRWSREEVK